MKKWKFNGKTKVNAFGVTLFQIEATADFKEVKSGEVGGWIGKENNLSGDAWVCGNAEVYGDAEVCGDALVCGDAEVCGNAKVYGNAWVCGNAKVCGNAEVCGDALVCGDAEVYGNAEVCGDALVCGDAEVCGNAKVYGNAWVCGNAKVCGDAEVCGDADYIAFHGFGSANRITTAFKLKDGGVGVRCGCFYGTVEEFEEKVKEQHGDSLYAKEYLAIVEVMKIHFGLK